MPQQKRFISITEFIKKIPNKAKLREFLVNTCHYHCPPNRDLTKKFTKEILSGKKKLLKLTEVNWVENVPLWPEFSAKALW